MSTPSFVIFSLNKVWINPCNSCLNCDWYKILEMRIYFFSDDDYYSPISLRSNKRNLSTIISDESQAQTHSSIKVSDATSSSRLKETFQSFYLLMNELYDLSSSIDILINEITDAKSSCLKTTEHLIDYLSSLLPSNKKELVDDISGEIMEGQKRRRLSFIAGQQQAHSSAPDSIVYFNVEGERICILKSTLQEMIPNSQLTIRVASGRWEEQAENLDEDGNIIIEDIPRVVFKKIIEGIRRGKLMNTKDLIIKVNCNGQKEIVVKYLDYLAIENYKFV
jgi:hypothetical protein